jgi:predicted nucleic acid-binding protein
MGIILDSSILVAFERRRFDLERLLTAVSPTAIAAVTAAELLIGVHRADTPERGQRRHQFVENTFARMRIVPFELAGTPVRREVCRATGSRDGPACEFNRSVV